MGRSFHVFPCPPLHNVYSWGIGDLVSHMIRGSRQKGKSMKGKIPSLHVFARIVKKKVYFRRLFVLVAPARTKHDSKRVEGDDLIRANDGACLPIVLSCGSLRSTAAEGGKSGSQHSVTNTAKRQSQISVPKFAARSTGMGPEKRSRASTKPDTSLICQLWSPFFSQSRPKLTFSSLGKNVILVRSQPPTH